MVGPRENQVLYLETFSLTPTKCHQNGYPATPGTPLENGHSYFDSRQHRTTPGATPTTPFPPPGAVPLETQDQRLERLNNEMCSMFRKRRHPNSRHPPYFKGNGTYTHVEKPSQRTSRSPLEQSATPELEFLPLGMHGRPSRSSKRATPVLQEPVKEAFRLLKTVLREECKLDRDVSSPQMRFQALPLPTANAFISGSPSAEETEMGGMDGDVAKAGSTVASTDASRRNSTVDTVVASTGPSRRSSTADVPQQPQAANRAATTGSTYDASRDPRKRGR
jgi:hypothetical protein